MHAMLPHNFGTYTLHETSDTVHMCQYHYVQSMYVPKEPDPHSLWKTAILLSFCLGSDMDKCEGGVWQQCGSLPNYFWHLSQLLAIRYWNIINKLLQYRMVARGCMASAFCK